MTPFVYTRAATAEEAVASLASRPERRFIAGGTNLVDLMKEGVERPTHLVDITRLDELKRIEEIPDGGMRIGALVSNAALADDARLRSKHPLVAQAVLAGASPQLRNVATTGGNLNQRTRCSYFTDTSMPCNKRLPGQGCAAREGHHHIHAILGWSEACIATQPSDMAVALAASDAVVRVLGPNGARTIAATAFHRLPEDAPERDTMLWPGELVTAVDLPRSPFHANVCYLKIRERASYAFATVSVAAALRIEGGRITDVRVALGGVAHKPWRSSEAETLLRGRSAERSAFDEAGAAAMAEAKPLRDTAYKVPLARRAVARALEIAALGETPAFAVSN